jgi:hypothetical protein
LKDVGVLIVQPTGRLAADAFRRLSVIIEPFIQEKGKLTGLLVDAPSFPGWESFGALIEHMKFVADHQRKIERIAAVAESEILKIAPKIAQHFAPSKIRSVRLRREGPRDQCGSNAYSTPPPAGQGPN